MCLVTVYVQCRRDIDERDMWRWSSLVMCSPRSSVLLIRPTLANWWSVYLLKTQMCLSCYYIACNGRMWIARCRWSGEICQCWATVSAVVLYSCPHQMRHDLIFRFQNQDQSNKHFANWRFPRIMRWRKWAQRRQKPWSAAGVIHWTCPLHNFHQEEEMSQTESPACDIS